jgi:phosphoglycerate dehydrogenase-like enzyme
MAARSRLGGVMHPSAGVFQTARRMSTQGGGAILDVFDPKPLPAESDLWTTPNLLITPHCSSDDLDRYIPTTLDLIFENVARSIAGLKLLNRVDVERQY